MFALAQALCFKGRWPNRRFSAKNNSAILTPHPRSPDGHTIYFVRAPALVSGRFLFPIRKRTVTRRSRSVLRRYSDADPFITGDGKQFIFLEAPGERVSKKTTFGL
jgi:hypothetical protein